MVLKFTSLLAAVILISGCATTGELNSSDGPDEVSVKTFADIYRQAKQARMADNDPLTGLKMDEPLGYVKPYLPVMVPPKVIKVWVPSHVMPDDREVMVSGHWAFVMTEPPKWFIEQEAPRAVNEP